MIPDNTPVLIIANNGDDAYAFIRTKSQTLDELDNFFGSGMVITTAVEPLKLGHGVVSLLHYEKPKLFVLLFCDGRDVTNELLSEAWERHNRLHSN